MGTTAVPVEDRLAIQDLVARYSFYCDTKRYQDCAPLFAEAGQFDETVIGIPLSDGRPAIDATFRGMDGLIDFLAHLTSNHRIGTYDTDSAAGTVHVHVLGSYQGAGLEVLGYYEDDYVKQHGQWLFARRRLVEIAPSVGLSAEQPL
jgi:hypothetical protein